MVGPPKTAPRFAGYGLSGSNLILSGTNGVAGQPYYVLTSTNVALPPGQWIPVATNFFDSNGNFQFTNAPGPGAAGQQFYLLQLP
jgi:hypothetical protein